MRFIKVEIILPLILVGALAIFNILRLDDLTNTSKASKVQSSLLELRTSLELYYQSKGVYPNLYLISTTRKYSSSSDKEYVKDVLSTMKMRSIPKTPEFKELEANNFIYNVTDFQGNLKKDGGWMYNYEEQSGEIHPNLPDDIFNQGITWSKY